MTEARIDKTALSYWFPRLVAAGLPVPRTALLEMPRPAQEDVWSVFDGKEGPNGALPAFFAEIDRAAQVFGYPAFLRSDHTSNKHDWEHSCFLTCAADIPRHVFSIAEFSEIADFMGLPWSHWAVRELLPTVPFGVCPHYGHMPINREFRFFVDDGVVRCRHPYWPAEALSEGGAVGVDFERLSALERSDAIPLNELASAAGRAVGGSWSIDLLETTRGWYVTDMAEADRSFHWPDCEAVPASITPAGIKHQDEGK